MSERVILAYSGGLDTSVAISWIGKETGREVVAVAIDLGQGGEDMEVVRQRALDCGAVEAVVVDARDEFAERVLPARHPVQRALHGPLPIGVGDQPAADRQAPGDRGARVRRRHRRARLHRQGQRPGAVRGRVRLARTGSGGAGARSATTRGRGRRPSRSPRRTRIPINVTKRSPFSIDQNVWGRAVETGFLEHLWNAPTKDVYDYTEDPTVNWSSPDEVIVGFERGVPVSIDGRPVTVLQAIEELNRRARRAGCRPARRGRGPAGRHQEPRDLRGARRDGADHRAHRAGTRHARARAGPVQAARPTSAGVSWCTTGCGTRR